MHLKRMSNLQNTIDKDLLTQFLESAQATDATVETSSRNIQDITASLLKATADDKRVLFAQPDFISPELFAQFILDGKVITKPTKDELSSVTTGVTDAFAAVASTGSICVSVSGNQGSIVSLLTRRHIAVLDSHTIVPRPRDIFENNTVSSLKRSFSFITGPSATADMGPLVKGVHGPGQLHIIVLE
jgi:L-lactate dehydrogenase complex protein LldG